MTIPLKVSDIGSGVNYINFTLLDITVTIGKNGNNKTILKSGFKFDNTALTCSISLTTYHKVQN